MARFETAPIYSKISKYTHASGPWVLNSRTVLAQPVRLGFRSGRNPYVST